MNPTEGSLSEARRRTERWLIVGVIGYAALVAAIMLRGGLEVSADLLLVAVGLTAILAVRARAGILRDWLPFPAIFLAYELMRGIPPGDGLPVHVSDVVAIERALFGGRLPTELLQALLAPADGVGVAAIAATVLYLLFFAVPVLTGVPLWTWRRAEFHTYLTAFVLLSLVGFSTFLLLPVAPPWYAADAGVLTGPDGEPTVRYLKLEAFAEIATSLGLADGQGLGATVFYDVNPNGVAAFPSLHAAQPFLSFLVLRRAFGRWGWLALAYAVPAWWAIVFVADHYVIDVVGGIAYATAVYLATPRLIGALDGLRWPWRRGTEGDSEPAAA